VTGAAAAWLDVGLSLGGRRVCDLAWQTGGVVCIETSPRARYVFLSMEVGF
jgi:hypothetical protein